MADFFTCLRAAVAAGTLSQDRVQPYEEVYQGLIDDVLKEKGKVTQADKDLAATQTILHFSKKTPAKAWERAASIRWTGDTYTRFAETQEPDQLLKRMGASMQVYTERVKGDMFAAMSEFLVHAQPGIIKRPIEELEQVVRLSYGETVPNQAVHRWLDSYLEGIRVGHHRANQKGASIAPLPDKRIGLFHSRKQIRAVEKRYYKEERAKALREGKSKEEAHKIADLKSVQRARKEFVDFNFAKMDFTRTHGGIPLVSNKQKYQYLNKLYDIAKSEGNSLKDAKTTMSESIIGRLNRETKVYYTDAEAFLEAQRRWSSGDILTQMVSDIEILARDIGLVEAFGPNPELGLRMSENMAVRRASEIEKHSAKSRAIGKTKAATSLVRSMFRTHAHQVSMGHEHRGAQFIGATKDAAVMGVLGGAAISAATDPIFSIFARLSSKMPALNVMRDMFTTIGALGDKEKKAALVHITGVGEALVGDALAYQRFVGEFEGPEFTKVGLDKFFRATGMNVETWIQQVAHYMDTWHTFAMSKDMKFDDIPWRLEMERWGITADDWDEFRKTPVRTEIPAIGETYMLRPHDMLEREDLDPSIAQNISDKFYDFATDLRYVAVPEPTLEVRAQLGSGVDRDTYPGMVSQAFAAVKGFALSIMLVHFRRIMNQPTIGGKALEAGKFALLLTFAGAMITQAKEMLLYGRDPQPMNTAQFWARAFANGGSWGFLGDALFSNVNQYRGGGISEAFGGPLIELYSAARDLTVGNVLEIVEGQDTRFGREATEFVQRYAPIPWQGQLLMDRLLFEPLMQAVDPAAYSRMQSRVRKRQTELNQGYYWRPGTLSPF